MPQTYDLTLKSIFSDIADDIIVYLTGINFKKLEELNIEFTRVERRDSDMIFKCDTDTGEIAVHIEFQAENDKMMPCRMLRYALEIMEKHKLKPYQVVLYIGKDKAKMDNGIDYAVGDNKLDYRYRIIDIGEFRFSDIAETNYFDLYSLLPIVDRRKRVEAGEKYLKMCVDLIKDAPVDVDEKRTILFRAELLSGIAYSKEVIKRIFEEVERVIKLEELSSYKMIMEKGKAEMVLKLLNKKFKELPKKYEELIKSADNEVLERITDDIFDIEKPEDLEKYFSK
ncbi:Putative transposase, YhgA-like [Caldanaerobius fijiensis DSM 17918]|uniref:Putative transposase, YhgA-like n=1 Tax=Caldanaerobius fijiensis DSM 17918 TaxID=1121256 RepID=A0A1M5CL45_9THEO|nr:DUF4351 domain-containing protein [Caldanaerobius fijiensis]SHF55421.1 Putative transposase, YhgA-like [Caldanaerobius fijiensis DSM 17918]